MLVFLQQSISNRNTFATVNDPTKATHFQKNGGQIRTISELPENNDHSEVEPLEILSMNFGDEETFNAVDFSGTVEPLEIPSIF